MASLYVEGPGLALCRLLPGAPLPHTYLVLLQPPLKQLLLSGAPSQVKVEVPAVIERDKSSVAGPTKAL
jgi:hypothetical protein